MSGSDNKKFIILQEDDKGFSFNGKKSSGYTKIENKDFKFKIFYYVQNLNTENTYTLNLILKNDDKIEIISIGDAKTDENGKIDIAYDFDESILDNVCGSAVCVKDFKGMLKFPLSGFLPKKRILNWKVDQFRAIKNRPFRREIVSFEKKKESEIDVDKDLTNDVDNDKKIILDEEPKKHIKTYLESNDVDNEHDVYSKYDNQDAYSFDSKDLTEDNMRELQDNYHEHENIIRGIIDTSKENCSQAKYHIDALKKLLKKDNGSIEKMIKNLFPELFRITKKFKGSYEYRFFLNILCEYEEIDSVDFNEFRVFKVCVSKFSEMENVKKYDNVKYAVVYYPMLCMYPYFKDKGYFIIGINCNECDEIPHLIYGVEVKNNMENEFPYDGEIGFNKYVYDYGTSKGYHIMEYDYKECVIK